MTHFLGANDVSIYFAAYRPNIDAQALQTSLVLNLSGTLDQPETGFITGSIVADNDTGNIACIVNTNTGTAAATLISCTDQNPEAGASMFNLNLKG
ncbi:MAG: hypothetical protein ACR2PZ_11040 [Pseudomonadales bacterium]